jgi:hypothetical protein
MSALGEQPLRIKRANAAAARDPIEVQFQSGAASSSIPNFALIPYAAMVAAARRYERGIRLKKEKAWNALSPNQKPLEDREFLINRLVHAIDHCYLAINRLAEMIPPASEEEEADGGDEGAILFAGGLLAAAKAKMQEVK